MDDEHQFVQFQSAIESNIHLFMLSSETQPCPVTVGIELKYILGSLSPFLCCLSVVLTTSTCHLLTSCCVY